MDRILKNFPKRLDVNSATVAEIERFCTSLGSEKSWAIVNYRENNGPYKTLEELRVIPGFSDKLISRLRDFLVVKQMT